jgi:hypothetical protein
MTDFSALSDQELLAIYQRAKTPSATPRKLTSQEAAQLRAARETAQSSGSAARDADRFIAINQDVGTGEFWSLPAASEVRGAFDPRFAEMQSLTNRMAPAQRQAGSGAMSDKDVALFKRSVPNPDFPGPTNAAIARRLKDEASRSQGYAAFLDQYAQQNGTLLGAEAAWAAQKPAGAPAARAKPVTGIPGQTTVKPDFGAMTPAQRRAAGRFRGSKAPSGTEGNPSIPVSEQQYNALPKGAVYLHPDGTIKRKP